MIEEDPDEVVNAMQMSVWGGKLVVDLPLEDIPLTVCFLDLMAEAAEQETGARRSF